MKNNSSLFSRLTNTKQKRIEENPTERIIKKKAPALPSASIESNYLSNVDIRLNRKYDNFDTDEILRGIEEFDKIDLKTIKQEDLRKLLMKIVPYNLVNSIKLRKDAELFRARSWTHSDGGNSPVFEVFDDIWYPKPVYLKKLGRLNEAGKPMLYVSMDALTPVYEIRNNVDEQFAMIKYKLKSGETLELATIATELDSFAVEALQRFYSWTEKGLKNWQIINDFIVSLFKKKVASGEEYRYRATIELLNIFDYPGCDGYMYPSVEMADGGLNIAIKPASADRALEFDGLAYVFNDNYRGSKVRINKGDFSIWQKWAKKISGGKIIYEPIGPCKLTFPNMGEKVVANETCYHSS